MVPHGGHLRPRYDGEKSGDLLASVDRNGGAFLRMSNRQSTQTCCPFMSFQIERCRPAEKG